MYFPCAGPVNHHRLRALRACGASGAHHLVTFPDWRELLGMSTPDAAATDAVIIHRVLAGEVDAFALLVDRTRASSGASAGGSADCAAMASGARTSESTINRTARIMRVRLTGWLSGRSNALALQQRSA